MEGNADRRMERRATGVNKVVFSDGNGGRQELIQVNVEKAKVWVNVAKAAVALILMIAGAMWGAVKFGVSSEVHTEVESAMEEQLQPGGKIHYGMTDVAMEAVEEIQGVLQDDLDDADQRLRNIEKEIPLIKGSVENLSEQNQRNADEIKMLLQEAIIEARDDGSSG